MGGHVARKVTLKQIAEAVGMSPTAVSLVLNDRPCRVSDANKRRIRETARRLNYVPNQIARSLVTRHSNTIGLIVPNIASPLFSSLAKSLEARARKCGYALFITNTDGDPENDAEFVRLLVNHGVDGLLIVVSDEVAPSERLIEDLEGLPVPYVMVDRFIGSLACDKVRFNNEQGGYLATRELIRQGHRRIGCIVNERSNTGADRLSGYRRALVEAGIQPRQEYVVTSDYYIPDAYEASARLLGTDVTAVFASSDSIVLGLLRRLYGSGLSVPRDCSVVSYDNMLADTMFELSLTSVEQNVDSLSAVALDLLLKRIREASQDVKADPEEILLAPTLVSHESVATPRVTEPGVSLRQVACEL